MGSERMQRSIGAGRPRAQRGTVLLVDDEAIVRDVVRRYLEIAGYEVLEAEDPAAARDIVAGSNVDLVVLDLLLPRLDGLDLCRWIRARGDLPVVMLSSRAHETDRIVGLESGADDYVVKPFSPRELLSRVAAVLRRASGGPGSERRIVVDGLVIDPRSRQVMRGSAIVALTSHEFDLLLFLALHPRQVFSRNDLLDHVWGSEATAAATSVTVAIKRLREKVESDPTHPRLVETIRGVGYRLSP